jgi:hypothetical protein
MTWNCWIRQKGGLRLRHFRTELRTPGVASLSPAASVSVSSRLISRADSAHFAVRDLDPFGERAEMVAGVAPPSILIRSRAVVANLWTISGVISC